MTFKQWWGHPKQSQHAAAEEAVAAVAWHAGQKAALLEGADKLVREAEARKQTPHSRQDRDVTLGLFVGSHELRRMADNIGKE